MEQFRGPSDSYPVTPQILRAGSTDVQNRLPLDFSTDLYNVPCEVRTKRDQSIIERGLVCSLKDPDTPRKAQSVPVGGIIDLLRALKP